MFDFVQNNWGAKGVRGVLLVFLCQGESRLKAPSSPPCPKYVPFRTSKSPEIASEGPGTWRALTSDLKRGRSFYFWIKIHGQVDD